MLFKNTLRDWAVAEPDNLLFKAWIYRFGISSSLVSEINDTSFKEIKINKWLLAIPISLLTGIILAFLTGGKNPFPAPGLSNPLYWIGWSSLISLSFLFYLSFTDSKNRNKYYLLSSCLIVLTFIVSLIIAWDMTGDTANLIALHLPLLNWIFVGFSVIGGKKDYPNQIFRYLYDSMEIIVGSAIYLFVGIFLVFMTFGIFSILSVEISENITNYTIAMLLGIVPVLSLTTIYEPFSQAKSTKVLGFTYFLQTLTRIFLPIITIILLFYVCWFIPTNFWKPFTQLEAQLRQREILIIYNLTILAVIIMIIRALPEIQEHISSKLGLILKNINGLACSLSILLNLYSLVVILSRIYHYGLTPNRLTVMGWNILTLIILGWLLFNTVRAVPKRLAHSYRNSILYVAIPAIFWIACVIYFLPLFFL